MTLQKLLDKHPRLVNQLIDEIYDLQHMPRVGSDKWKAKGHDPIAVQAYLVRAHWRRRARRLKLIHGRKRA